MRAALFGKQTPWSPDRQHPASREPKMPGRRHDLTTYERGYLILHLAPNVTPSSATYS
jgi:hypothetical protein